jgi:hypothetical protein
MVMYLLPNVDFDAWNVFAIVNDFFFLFPRSKKIDIFVVLVDVVQEMRGIMRSRYAPPY